MHTILLILAALVAVSSITFAAPQKPNIVLLLADDLGYGDIGCYGASDIRTPVLDRLASKGVRFTNFYANGTECSPTRTALLTGRYQQRVGGLECAIGNGNVGRYDDAIRLRETHDLGLPAEEMSIARLLKDVGYATCITGKWHLGYEPKFGPQRHGFDHSFISLGGGMEYFYHLEEPPVYTPVLELNGKPIRRDGYFTDLIADEAVQFISEHKAQPFFLYVPFTAPHAPYQGPDDRQPEPLAADSPLWKQNNGPSTVYAAMIERMDSAIGRILASLESHGIANRTIVIFQSDNGGTLSARPNGLRGIKSTAYEGGIRVPCIVRWPNVLPEQTTTAQAAITMDFTASIARIAGAKPAADHAFDGIDILSLLKSRQSEIQRTLFWRGRRGNNSWKAVRDGSLKYVQRTENGKTTVEGLFDLSSDRGETRDLLPFHPDDAAKLRKLLARWEEEVQPHR